MTKSSEKALLARDSQRVICAELLQSVRDLKAGRWGRRTTIETMPGGTVRRRVELPNGTVAKDEVLTGARWALVSARSHSGRRRHGLFLCCPSPEIAALVA